MMLINLLIAYPNIDFSAPKIICEDSQKNLKDSYTLHYKPVKALWDCALKSGLYKKGKNVETSGDSPAAQLMV